MGKLAHITWPQEYSDLERIEELLLCGICYEYMDTSVMTPCSHNYCSLCIRKYLHYKTQCPACFEKTFEKDLHTNRILDELISYFTRIREKLVNCIAGAKIDIIQDAESIENEPKTTPVRPARTNQGQRKIQPKVDIENEIHGEPAIKMEKYVHSNHEPEEKILPSATTSGTCKIATIFTPKSKKKSLTTITEKNVPCPICGVNLSELHINKHLDSCLKRETVQEPIRIEPKRKPLPKLVFNLMKDAELRKRMKELGLPHRGDRKTLEARFHRYLTLYNAECDKREPRPVEELLKHCENEEFLEKKMMKLAQTSNRLKVSRTCEQNIIEEAQKKYLEANRHSYQSLIANMKEREKIRKPPVRRSLIAQIGDSSDSSINYIAENDVNHITEVAQDPVCYSVNAYASAFQDADSNSSCPLQYYASDDPMNFLSLTMKSSDTDESPPKTPSRPNRFHFAQQSNGTLIPDDPVLPVENVTLGNINNKLLSEEFSTAEAVNQSMKRAKLSLRDNGNDDNNSEVARNDLTGQELALSITRDFTFDTSSNDCTESDTVHEVDDAKRSTLSNIDEPKIEHNTRGVLNLEKENFKSATESVRFVDQAVQKRNCVPRSEIILVADSVKSDENAITAPDEPFQSGSRENAAAPCPSRNNSPLKRRRRRQVVRSDEADTENPPRRPLRKRYGNFVST